MLCVLPRRRRIEFETDLFVGCALVWVLGVPSAPAGLFSGQRRKTAIVVQGRFKRALSAEEVVTGQEFGRAPKNLPAKWLVETVLVRVSSRRASAASPAPVHQCHTSKEPACNSTVTPHIDGLLMHAACPYRNDA